MQFTDKPFNEAEGAAVVFNTEAAYFFLTDKTYREHVQCARWLYCDGAGLAAYIRWRFGSAVPRRHGPDVLAHYLASVEGRSVLLFGGSAEAHTGLRRRYPRFFEANVVECDTAHYSREHYPRRAAEIASRDSFDDVLIFLGLRRQEAFQTSLHTSGFTGASIGLGAAIDFLSGTKQRAGKTWQKMGLEWLPRMVAEPRMIPRVFRSFGLFALWSNSANRDLLDAIPKDPG